LCVDKIVDKIGKSLDDGSTDIFVYSRIEKWIVYNIREIIVKRLFESAAQIFLLRFVIGFGLLQFSGSLFA
jgi:hypothetical protein